MNNNTDITIMAIFLIILLLVVIVLFISEWRKNNEKINESIQVLIDLVSLSLDGRYVITYDVDKHKVKLERNEDE